MALGKGDLLRGRYRILASLGLGGMGAVYKAFDESLKVDVAVKENLFITDEYATQFRTEAEILASLRHPNLPRVTDYFVVNNVGQYLVMDFIEGEDLRQRMEHNQFVSEEDAIQIGASLCEALTYLHSRKPPVLHRDIKPGNVRIAPDGHVYLVDFGLAKRVEHESEQTYSGAQAMTPGYSPPEQYGSARTDARTDIYSLGATLYAALTGIIPEDALLRAVDGDKLKPIRKLNPRITPRLESVVIKAMAIQPAGRYQSAAEFGKALRGELDPKPMLTQAAAEALTVPPVEESRPRTGRPKPATAPLKKSGFQWGWLFLLVFLLTIGAGFLAVNPGLVTGAAGAVFPFLEPTPTPPPSATATLPPTASQTATIEPTTTLVPTQTPEPTATPEAQPEATQQAGVPTPSPEPGPPQILYASLQGSTAQLFIAGLEETESRPVFPVEGGACQPDWSPDAARIVFVSPCTARQDTYPDASLYLLDLATGQVEALPLGGDGNFEPAWSPDGRRIVFTSLRDGHQQVYLYDLETRGELRLTTTEATILTRHPVWSPDGGVIYFSMRRFGLYQIWRMAPDGQGQEQVIRSGGGMNDFLPAVSPDGSTLLFSQTGRDITDLPRLMRYLLDGSQPLGERIVLPEPITDVSFSLNGQWVAYETSDGRNQDIYLYNVETGRAQRWTTSPQADFDPVWQP